MAGQIDMYFTADSKFIEAEIKAFFLLDDAAMRSV
jgi:hypothetical protein